MTVIQLSKYKNSDLPVIIKNYLSGTMDFREEIYHECFEEVRETYPNIPRSFFDASYDVAVKERFDEILKENISDSIEVMRSNSSPTF